MDDKCGIEGVEIGDEVIIGKNVTIYPPCFILGASEIGDNCVILPNCYIKDSKIGKNIAIFMGNYIENTNILGDCNIYPNNFIKDSNISYDCDIKSSNIEGSFIDQGAIIGPYARLRSGSVVREDCLVGAFVEMKNATLGAGSKASHLAYMGACTIGKNCNIGCGAIFVNYNGREKNKSVVGDNCFIGSNCNIIAPVKIESGSYICAGTTVTENIEKDDFVIGRNRQMVKKNRAHDYLSLPDETNLNM